MKSQIFALLFVTLICTVYSATPTCTAYCNNIQTNCGAFGVNATGQYSDNAACMAVCAKFPVGLDNGEVSGNTLGCREYHSTAAAGAGAAVHCIHAGPSGGDTCGKYCDVYCNLSLTTCTGANTVYDDASTCNTTCNLYNFSNVASFPSDTSGGTFSCRMYHLSVASQSAALATTHCPHTGQSGGTVCGSKCQNYCDLFGKTCAGQTQILNNAGASCLSFCANLTSGTFGDRANNTVECRAYHASFPSVLSASLHCPHASINGNGGCGTLCEVYCYYSSLGCTGSNQIYTTPAICMTNCTAFSAAQLTGAPGAVDGDSLQCRIYHLSVATQSAANAAVHCPHGKSISATCTGGSSSTTSTTATTATSATTSSTGTGTGDSTRFGFLFVLSFLGMLLI
jgi:hypothetical protein